MKVNTKRIESIDILRGVVMIIMALDHVRDYFHFGAFLGNPTDLETTTPILFFTRFITHYAAPVFVLLTGTSAFLYGSKKSKPELFKFLFTRGIWLIVLEIVVNNFLWSFDVTYGRLAFQVIWAIGLSMICLSFLIYLPKKVIFIIGILLLAGHNLLDSIKMEGESLLDIVWYFLHQQNTISISANLKIGIYYPVIPWIGIMALGYLLGSFYQKDFDVAIRKKWLLRIGLGALALFFVLRGFNLYGDLAPWSQQDTFAKTVMSFFKVSKYPPSLLFACITLGPALIFLYAIEKTKNKITNFLLVFGRVPLFYYFLHILVIHLFAIGGLLISGGDWKDMILTTDFFADERFLDYGYPLYVVYLVWIAVIIFLYPFSKKYMIYKANNKDKWWLSYL